MPETRPTPNVAAREYALPWPDYELLDAGNGKKLERWGDNITIRPDILANCQAIWPYEQWQTMAHWEFEESSSTQGIWKNLQPHNPEHWQIDYGQLQFGLRLTQFKHVGLFPEQQANWRFIREHTRNGHKVLNLFAYTGAASLVAASSGATVTHVDSVRQMLTWASGNMERSGLNGIRWVLEDALKFAQRELKRGNRYDGIIMDPPAWGLGTKGEKWKLENHLHNLVTTAHGLMQPEGYLIINTYSPKITLPDLAKCAEAFFSAPQTEIKQLYLPAKSGNELYCGNLLRIRR